MELVKGQCVPLWKEHADIPRILAELGWKEIPRKTREGHLEARKIDCDLFTAEIRKGVFETLEDVAHYTFIPNRAKTPEEGDYKDEERIVINLEELPAIKDGVVLIMRLHGMMILDRHFGLLEDVYIRLLDEESEEEICQYWPQGDYEEYLSIVLGEFRRSGEGWYFRAIGEVTEGSIIDDLVRRYH